MKITSTTLEFIQNVVKTAQLVGIDNIIIDSESVRGLSDGNTVVLLEKDVPELEIGAIGLNRTDVFQSRFDVVRELPDFKIDAVIDEEKGFVRALTMKAKGTKVDYRCANPTNIRAPRIINDTLSSRVAITNDVVKMLQKGASAMGAELVEFRSDDAGVSFAFVDVNNDTFEHTFAESAEPLDKGSSGHFRHKYPVKTILALFKNESSTHFDVGTKGTLLVKINNLGVYVIPKV